MTSLAIETGDNVSVEQERRQSPGLARSVVGAIGTSSIGARKTRAAQNVNAEIEYSELGDG